MQAAINEAVALGEDPSIVDITAIRAKVFALGLIDIDVQMPVEDAADSLTRLWLPARTCSHPLARHRDDHTESPRG